MKWFPVFDVNIGRVNTYMCTGCGRQVGHTLSSRLTSSTVSGNHTAALQAGYPVQDRYVLQRDGRRQRAFWHLVLAQFSKVNFTVVKIALQKIF